MPLEDAHRVIAEAGSKVVQLALGSRIDSQLEDAVGGLGVENVRSLCGAAQDEAGTKDEGNESEQQRFPGFHGLLLWVHASMTDCGVVMRSPRPRAIGHA
jgi:hypothetical protein